MNRSGPLLIASAGLVGVTLLSYGLLRNEALIEKRKEELKLQLGSKRLLFGR